MRKNLNITIIIINKKKVKSMSIPLLLWGGGITTSVTLPPGYAPDSYSYIIITLPLREINQFSREVFIYNNIKLLFTYIIYVH